MPDLATAGVVRGLSDPWRRGAKLGGANERRDDPEDEASRGGTRPRLPEDSPYGLAKPRLQKSQRGRRPAKKAGRAAPGERMKQWT